MAKGPSCLLALAVASAVGTAGSAMAQTLEPLALFLNERYIEEVRRDARFDTKDTMAVFAFVFGVLPERVTVYPTENYYYFRFVHLGVPYAGNMRFAPGDRDKGKLHFGYYEDFAPWNREGYENPGVLDETNGVKLERLGALIYKVTYKDKSVVFTLNDVSKVKPPSGIVGPDEIYIGAVFDESGVPFFLVFNQTLRIFHYILDETSRVPEAFAPAEKSDRILIGKRTGFAFYRDEKIDRKILIGVYEPNSEYNTYFDGPFDQLPENFIEGDVLRNAIIASDPGVRGEIDQLGHFRDKTLGRYAIHPYMTYKQESDLLAVHACATDRRVPAASYHRCFVIEPPPPGGVGRPLALRDIAGGK